MHRHLLRFATTCLCTLCLAIPATADTITHASDGPFPDVTLLLGAVGIPPTGETTAQRYVVPGAGPVELTFTFFRDTGSFLFNFGYFEPGGITADPVTEKELWATQALSSATLVFDDTLANPGATSHSNRHWRNRARILLDSQQLAHDLQS